MDTQRSAVKRLRAAFRDSMRQSQAPWRTKLQRPCFPTKLITPFCAQLYLWPSHCPAAALGTMRNSPPCCFISNMFHWDVFHVTSGPHSTPDFIDLTCTPFPQRSPFQTREVSLSKILFREKPFILTQHYSNLFVKQHKIPTIMVLIHFSLLSILSAVLITDCIFNLLGVMTFSSMRGSISGLVH